MPQMKTSSLNKIVFFPPLILLVFTIAYAIVSPEPFLAQVKGVNHWILINFGWLFYWSTFIFLIILIFVYFSPLGSKIIGGEKAVPLVNKWSWFAIAICTTTASALLFWACAEPLYHLHSPPSGLGITAFSETAKQFAISTLFMHWSFTPYGIYTVGALAFALAFYNLKQPYSISGMLFPSLKERAHGSFGTLADMICLYALIFGMAGSLGGGLFAISGGLESLFNIKTTPTVLALTCITIVGTFIISSATGLQKGIRFFSNVNIIIFFVLAIGVFILGPTRTILVSAFDGIKDYFLGFIPRSINLNSNINIEWSNDWTVFYLANWCAWAPISALFLGRLGVGYTVRQFIHFNLIYPALFSIFWMSIFGGTAVHLDLTNNGELYQVMTDLGEGSAMFSLFKKLPFGLISSFLALSMLFIAYITAADSNISAMSALSSKGISPKNQESAAWIKATWGTVIGLVAFIMISTAGIDGIRILSVLGGFPALFLIILAAFGLLKLTWETKS
ncbi:MAG: glycine betaine transporter [Arcticibacterium sp.]|jgi:glycine betaine transporter